MAVLKAIGLMSGTSLDGIDVALIETDGQNIKVFGSSSYRPYTAIERAILQQALSEGVELTERSARPGILARAEQLVTKLHGDVVEAFLAENKIPRSQIDIVGFHGQTVLHRPSHGLTIQIGDGAALAQRLGLVVAYDFRAADVAAGGQGAPLVPVFHQALVEAINRPKPIAVLNIGGVANITFIDDRNELIACDTGPGNAIIDDFMRAQTGRDFDDSGITASRGIVDGKFVDRVLAHPFFDAKPPKSLDRNAFSLANLGIPPLCLTDGAATLAALTAAAVQRVVVHLPRPPKTWIVAGGGARNKTLLRMLAEHLAPASVETADAAGFSADALEAQAFAFLAVRTLKGMPITFPTTTGTPSAMKGGVLSKPN